MTESLPNIAMVRAAFDGLESDVARLIELAAALTIATKTDYTEVATTVWNDLPKHLQDAIEAAEERMESSLQADSEAGVVEACSIHALPVTKCDHVWERLQAPPTGNAMLPYWRTVCKKCHIDHSEAADV